MSTDDSGPISGLLARLPPPSAGDATVICERWDLDLCVLGRRRGEGELLLFVTPDAAHPGCFRVLADPGPPTPGPHSEEALLGLLRTRLGWYWAPGSRQMSGQQRG
jgi:hypothetical protein